jgi:hypothetical protein
LAEVTITAATVPCQHDDYDVIYYDDETSRYYCDCNMVSLSGTAAGNISEVISVGWECINGCDLSGSASGTTSWSTGDFYLNAGSNIIRVTAQHQDGSTSTDSVNVYWTDPSGTHVTFPYSLDFDAGLDSLEGLISASKGAAVRYEDSQCWRGGCAKFVPSNESNSYAALGGFNLPSDTRRVHLRYLVFYGPDYVADLNRRHKHIIIHRGSDVSGDRGMVYAWKTSPDREDLSLGACDNTDCTYEDGKTRPDLDVSFLVGEHLLEWVCVEAVFDTNNHTVQVYITTQDGAFNNYLLAERSIHSITSSQDYWTRISVLGAYMDFGTHINPPLPGMYWMLDEVAMSTSYIGPPDGFVTGYDDPQPNLTDKGASSLLTFLSAFLKTRVIYDK